MLVFVGFGVWINLWQVDIKAARANFIATYPEAARYITSRREMEAGFPYFKIWQYPKYYIAINATNIHVPPKIDLG